MDTVSRISRARAPSKEQQIVATAREFLIALLSGPAAGDVYEMVKTESVGALWLVARFLAGKYVSDLMNAEEEQRQARLEQNTGERR
jgi:hypothetical protein